MNDLLSILEAYAGDGRVPMHMPGHKRNPALSMPNPYAIDITEIDGFDNLHHAEGILRDGMERTAELYGSRRCFHLVNGSTVGLLAGIRAMTRKGGAILMARNCHKAVYNAAILNELHPVYLLPDYNEGFSVNGSVSAREVERLLAENPGICAVAVTSPTYEGVVSDIRAISEVCHIRGIPLLVDEAHGAHLGFHPAFPPSAVSQGADIVVQSFHKTLPSLTQTAVLHVCSERVPAEEIRRTLEIFETSSPSYVLMASIERCVSLLRERGDALFRNWVSNLAAFDRQADALTRLRVLGYGRNRRAAERFAGFDPSKLVISAKSTNLTGAGLADFLRRAGIEPEMISADYLVAMTSLCDTPESLAELAKVLLTADREAETRENPPEAGRMPPCEPVLTPYEAGLHSGRILPWEQSAGQISRDFVFAYPPGIPIVAPGERISVKILRYVESLKRQGVSVQISGGEDTSIEVIS